MRSIKDYKVEISRLTEADGDGYIAHIPELDCIGDGATMEEAIADVYAVSEDLIEIAMDDGKDIPQPMYYKDLDEFSGKLSIRLSKSLHKMVSQRAQAEGCSINQLINIYVATGICDAYYRFESTVENQIRLQKSQTEKRMRKYVEDAYGNASFLYSTGYSMLFYQRHDRKPTELKFCFDTDSEDIKTWIKQNKLKYITNKEFDIILERLKTDTSKRFCEPRCIGFWKSEKNASRYHIPVSFHGENPNYCDKSECIDCNK